MSSSAPRLARFFTPTYAQIVHPAESQGVKQNELESALARPLHVSVYQPEKTAVDLAASLSYGIIKGDSRVSKVYCHHLNVYFAYRASIP